MSSIENSLMDDLSIPTLDGQWNQEQDYLSFLNSDENMSSNHSPVGLDFSSGDSPTSSPLHDPSSDSSTQLAPLAPVFISADPLYEVKEEPSSLPTTPAKTKIGKRVREDKKPQDLEKDRSKGNDVGAFYPLDVKLNLTRDDLLKFSSKELEDYAHSLANARPLTVDEEKQLKRQRRLIKNRESAQLSRLRKKVYIDELEKKVAILNAENDQLKSQIGDKRKLQEEVTYLQSVIKQYQQIYGTLPTTSPTTLGSDDSSVIVSLPSSPVLPTVAPSTTITKKPVSTQKNLKTAGVCLLLVLFSFGLLFQSQPHQLALPDSPAPAMTGRSLLSAEPNASTLSIAANTLKVKQEQAEPVESIWKGLQKEKDFKKLSQEAIVIMNKFLPDYEQVQREEEISKENSQGKKKMKIMDSEMASEASTKSVVVLGAGSTEEERENATAVIQNTRFEPRDNTAYVYCPDAQQFSSPRMKPTTKPENIALLIPSTLFQSSLNKGLDPSLLEVSCQVMNYYTWPTIPTTVAPNNASAN